MISDEELKQMLAERKEIIDHIKNNFNEFVRAADNAAVRKYSTKCDGLGMLCESLIMYRRDKGLKKGKIIKDKGENTEYCIFEMDKENNPLRIQKFNEYGCESSYYFYTKGDKTYAVNFFRNTQDEYKYVYIYTIKNGCLENFAQVENSSIIYERYNYTSREQGVIQCDWCYYLDFSFADEPKNDYLSLIFSNKLKNSPGASNIKIPSKEIAPKRNDYQYLIRYEGPKYSHTEEYRLSDGEYVFIRKLK